MEPVAAIVVVFCCVALAVHLTSILLVLFRALGRSVPSSRDAAVTLLRPICGMENNIEETLASTFILSLPSPNVRK